jgi:hypothetical protein
MCVLHDMLRSAGKCRELGRRLDYWMIALSSAMLTRALYPGLPPVATAVSLASTPFKPFLVTTGNAMAMEGKFLQRALQNPGGCKAKISLYLCWAGRGGGAWHPHQIGFVW